MSRDGTSGRREAALEQAVQDMLNGRELDVWVEVRDSATGEALYSFRGPHGVRSGDEVTVTHRVGDVQVSLT